MPENYTTFGKYLLLKQISQDGMGSLWRAGEMEATGFKRIVWLRRLDGLSVDRAAVNQASTSVAHMVGLLKATNVVRNATFNSERGVGFVSWDYVPAQALDQMLVRVAQEQFPVAIDNALLITEKITAALAAALAFEGQPTSPIHGFLVPHLIMVGNDGEAMVAGFGAYRVFLANLNQPALRADVAPYLAPEVLASGQISPRSDVYSVGAILYHLLCGVALPVDPAARAAALERPQMAFDEGPVPADVLAIMRKAMASRPDERFGSASDLKKELEKLLYGGAYSPTTFNLALFMDRLYRTDIEEEDRELQRERALDVATYYQAPKAASAEIALPEEAAPAGNRTILYAAIAAAAVLLVVVGYLLFSRPKAPNVEEMNKMVAAEVARQMKEKEASIRKEVEEANRRAAEADQKLAEQQRAVAASGKRQSPEEAAKLEQLKQEAAARAAERQHKQEELAKVQQETQQKIAQAQAQAQAQARITPPTPTAVVVTQPTIPPVAVPTPVAAGPTAAPVQPVPTGAPAVAATSEPIAQPPSTGDVAGTVREGDLVDFTLVEVPPQVLVEAKVALPRAVLAAKSSATRGGGPALKAAGIVVLSALVNEKGTADDVKVLRGFPGTKMGIDEACIDAVRQYRFRPAIKQGAKVKTWLTVAIPVDLSKIH
jgi:Gram-negative bacterial TonB protein C-terminal/Protein tyrosine and serine/threonine kinase